MTIRAYVAAAIHVQRMLIQGEPIRHVAEWIRSLRRDYLVSRPSPWMTFDAIDYLRGTLDKGIKVFEYGSGGSTLFWLGWAKNVISIEHDQQWHALLSPMLQGRPVDYRLILPEGRTDASAALDPSDPASFASEDNLHSHHSFERYVRQIDSFDDRSFDVVCVDGRSRPSCVVHGAPKVKVGGILILDNSEREYYLRNSLHSLADFTRTDFQGYLPGLRETSSTSVFVRDR